MFIDRVSTLPFANEAFKILFHAPESIMDVAERAVYIISAAWKMARSQRPTTTTYGGVN